METPIEPECRVDRDCPAKMACIEDRCQNPCLTSNPCGRSQVCTVEDSYDGRRTVGCTCPPDQVSAGNNLCKTGREIYEKVLKGMEWDKVLRICFYLINKIIRHKIQIKKSKITDDDLDHPKDRDR